MGKAILDILTKYAKIKYVNVSAGKELITDKENYRYQVVTIGSQGNRFVHDCPIINGKSWTQ